MTRGRERAAEMFEMLAVIASQCTRSGGTAWRNQPADRPRALAIANHVKAGFGRLSALCRVATRVPPHVAAFGEMGHG